MWGAELLFHIFGAGREKLDTVISDKAALN